MLYRESLGQRVHRTTSSVRWSRVGSALLVVAFLAGGWAFVYAAGGTKTAFPHVFYIPIVFASLPFGLLGGVAAAAAATLLCGPAMPIDTATGESQQLVNWLSRGGFFVTVGALAGTSNMSLRRRFTDGLSRQLRAELDLAVVDDVEQDDPEWDDRIRQTLDNGSFRPVFQPIFALDDGRLIAVEALTRFDSEPTFPPDVWFAHADHAGLGVDLELAAVKAALEASASLPDNVALTFNASPAALCDPGLLHLLDRHSDRNLIAEVTEHAIIDDYQHLEIAIAELRSRGIRLAVDDAGAGFASFRHIVRLSPDFIKLDQSLTQDLGADLVRRPLADCLLQFATRTGSAIIAEGLETHTDLATWHELGAHAAQGYLLGRPGPLELDADGSIAPEAYLHAWFERPHVKAVV